MSVLTVRRAHLAHELRFILDGFPKRFPVAILAGARIEYADGTLTVSTFDYEVCSTATMPASGSEPVSLLVNARDLAAIVGKPARTVTGDVTFAIGEDADDVVTVSTDDVIAHLPLLPIVDYPSSPPVCDARFGTITDTAALGAVVHAASDDGTVPILTGVRFERSGQHMAAIATDRYRLAYVEWTDETIRMDSTIEPEALVPASVIKTVVRHLAGPVAIYARASWSAGGLAPMVTFASGNRIITARTLEGSYPKWRSLVPSDHNGAVSADGPAMVAAIKALIPMAGKLTPVRLVQGGNVVQVEIRADGEDTGPSATRLVTGAEFTGDVPVMTYPGGARAMVCVSPKYLAEAIGAVGKGRVTVSMTTGVKPIVISGPGPVRVLVMPTRPGGEVKHGHVSAESSAA